MRKPRLTEDIAHGLMVVAGLVDADMAADSERFDTDESWKQGGRAVKYIVQLARQKLAKVRKANAQLCVMEGKGQPMKFWAVTHRHTAYVEAETEAKAMENCVDQVRDNAEADDCAAEEISEHEYEQHWALIENGPHGSKNMYSTEQGNAGGEAHGNR